MTWQKQLRILEQHKEWDMAIALMEDTISQEPDNVDAYLSMAYLLMNLLVEEQYDFSQTDHYLDLAKRNYHESSEKFSSDPKYLFCMGSIMAILDWLLDKDTPDCVGMQEEALRLDPNNLLYQWDSYYDLDRKNPENRKKVCEYARAVLAADSPIRKILDLDSSFGKYLFGLITYWSKGILESDGMRN